jgi:hypothetical protein
LFQLTVALLEEKRSGTSAYERARNMIKERVEKAGKPGQIEGILKMRTEDISLGFFPRCSLFHVFPLPLSLSPSPSALSLQNSATFDDILNSSIACTSILFPFDFL